jgi:oligopeptide/dipeptide ABC transporter ATP-binding protein
MQIVYQNPREAFNPRFTLGQLIEEPIQLHMGIGRQARKQKVVELAEMVGLRPSVLNLRPFGLSAADLQRAAIARAISTSPRLVVLDEATSALDLSVRLEIVALLARLQAELGTSYIFISHDLTSVLRISDRVAIMYLGQLLEIGSADNIFKSPQQPYSKALLSSVLLPDPLAPKQRLRLSGEIPSPIDLPPGCPVASRCPLAEDDCLVAPPRKHMIDPDTGWWAACTPMSRRSRRDWEAELDRAAT